MKKIQEIHLKTRKLKAIFGELLNLRLEIIKESMENGTYPETYLNGPDADTCRDIWDLAFKFATRAALDIMGHGPHPAYTDDTVRLLVRGGRGKVMGAKPCFHTDVRLENGLYRIYKDSYEFGDGAVQLLEPAGVDSVVTGLEEDELAGFLLAFDALIPSFRKKMEKWSVEVAHAAKLALASKKADQIAQTSVDELLEKHIRPLGLDWDCSVSRGIVDLAIYGPEMDGYYDIPVGDFPAFIRDQKAFLPLLRGSKARA